MDETLKVIEEEDEEEEPVWGPGSGGRSDVRGQREEKEKMDVKREVIERTERKYNEGGGERKEEEMKGWKQCIGRC